MLAWGWSRKGPQHVAMLGCWWLHTLLCSDGINHLTLFCVESFATLGILQSQSTGNVCRLFCGWFWMSDLLLPHKNVAGILLQHNPLSHTSFRTQGGIKILGRSSPPTVQPRSCALRLPPLWSSQRCLLLEKVWECWRGYWRRGCKYRFQTGTKNGLDAVFSYWCKAVRSWWRLCRKMRCVVAFWVCSL